MSRFEDATEWTFFLDDLARKECPEVTLRNSTEVSIFYDPEKDVVVVESETVSRFFLENLWRFGVYDIFSPESSPDRIEISFQGPPNLKAS